MVFPSFQIVRRGAISMELARDDTGNSRAFIYPARHACRDQSSSLSLSLSMCVCMCVYVCVFHPESRLFRGPCEPLDCFFCRIVLLSREKPIIFSLFFFIRRCNFLSFAFSLSLSPSFISVKVYIFRRGNISAQ